MFESWNFNGHTDRLLFGFISLVVTGLALLIILIFVQLLGFVKTAEIIVIICSLTMLAYFIGWAAEQMKERTNDDDGLFK